jgi:hypothetical protein
MTHKLLTYVEYRAVSSVFQNIDPPPTSPPSECVLTPHQRRRVHTRQAVRGVGGSIFWKTPDNGLASYSIISLWYDSTESLWYSINCSPFTLHSMPYCINCNKRRQVPRPLLISKRRVIYRTFFCYPFLQGSPGTLICPSFPLSFWLSTVEGLNCERPIQCLASSKILTPQTLTARRVGTPRLWSGGRTHSLGGEGVGGNSTYLSTLCFLQREWSMVLNSWSPMLGGLNPLLPKEIWSRHWYWRSPRIIDKLVLTIFWYFDKTQHNTTFMSHNAASLNVIVSKRNSSKT